MLLSLKFKRMAMWRLTIVTLLGLALMGRAGFAADQASNVDALFQKCVGDFDWELQSPYTLIKFNSKSSFQSLSSLRRNLEKNCNGILDFNPTTHQFIWLGTAASLLYFQMLVDPLTVDVAMLQSDREFWQNVGEELQLKATFVENAAANKEKNQLVLLHNNGDPITIEEAFNLYRKIKIETKEWPGSDHTKHIYSQVQAVLLQELNELLTTKELSTLRLADYKLGFIKQEAASLAGRLKNDFTAKQGSNEYWTREKIQKWYPKLLRLPDYVDWFPQAAALLLAEVEFDGDGIKINTQLYQENLNYRQLIVKALPELASQLDDQIAKYKAQAAFDYKAAWNAIKLIAADRGKTELPYLLKLKTFKTEFRVGDLTEASIAAIKLIWQDVEKGFDVEVGDLTFTVEGDATVQGNLVQKNFSETEYSGPFYNRQGRVAITTEAITPAAILTNAVAINEKINRPGWWSRYRRQQANNSILFTEKQFSQYSERNQRAQESAAEIEAVMKELAPVLVVSPFALLRTPLGAATRQAFVVGTATHEINLAAASIYHGELPSARDIVLGGLTSGSMFAMGGILGKGISLAAPLVKESAAHTIGMVASGVLFAKYQGESWAAAGMQGLKMGIYSVAGSLVDRIGLAGKPMAVRIAASYTANAAISFAGGTVEHNVDGYYIDILGYTSKNWLQAGIMNAITSVGMDGATAVKGGKAHAYKPNLVERERPIKPGESYDVQLGVGKDGKVYGFTQGSDRPANLRVQYRMGDDGKVKITGGTLQSHLVSRGDAFYPDVEKAFAKLPMGKPNEGAGEVRNYNDKSARINTLNVEYKINADGKMVWDSAVVEIGVNAQYLLENAKADELVKLASEYRDRINVLEGLGKQDEALRLRQEMQQEYYQIIGVDDPRDYAPLRLTEAHFAFVVRPDGSYEFKGLSESLQLRSNVFPELNGPDKLKPILENAFKHLLQQQEDGAGLQNRDFGTVVRDSLNSYARERQNYTLAEIAKMLAEVDAKHSQPSPEAVAPIKPEISDSAQRESNRYIARMVAAYLHGGELNEAMRILDLLETTKVAGKEKYRKPTAAELEYLFQNHPAFADFQRLGLRSFAEFAYHLRQDYQQVTAAEAKLRGKSRVKLHENFFKAVEEHYQAKRGTRDYQQLLDYMEKYLVLEPGTPLIPHLINLDGMPMLKRMVDHAVAEGVEIRTMTRIEMNTYKNTHGFFFSAEKNNGKHLIAINPWSCLGGMPVEFTLEHELKHFSQLSFTANSGEKFERGMNELLKQLNTDRSTLYSALGDASEKAKGRKRLTDDEITEGIVSFVHELQAHSHRYQVAEGIARNYPYLAIRNAIARQYIPEILLQGAVAYEIGENYSRAIHPAISYALSDIDADRIILAADGLLFD